MILGSADSALHTAQRRICGSFSLGPQGCAVETSTSVTLAFTGGSLSLDARPWSLLTLGMVCLWSRRPSDPQVRPGPPSPQTGELARQSLPRLELSWGSLTSGQMQKLGGGKGTRPHSEVAFGRAGIEPCLRCGAGPSSAPWCQASPPSDCT